MKYLHTYNVSLRDQMEPKSEGDISKYLNQITLEDQLIKGCKEGLSWLVKKVLDEGVNVNYADDLALMWASIYGYIDIVKLLLKHGAIVTDKVYGNVVEHGDNRMIELLKKYKN